MMAKYDLDSEIVISGISGRFPNSENLDEFWQNLVEGKDMISDSFDRYNCEEFNLPSRLGIMKNLDRFDAGFFALHGKQAAVLDPRLRFLLETSYESIVDAGINPLTIQGTQTGVFLAASEGESCAISKRTGYKINQYAILGNVLSMLANRVSYSFDFRGPSYVVDTACSTSAVAIQQAIYSIRAGLCDAAIVAGVHTQQDPVSSYCFNHLKMTSPDGKCKVFDAAADGYVRAEAVVSIYICKKQFAKRAYATLVHAVTNNDGFTEQGITFPSVVQQERVMRQVYEDCGVNPLDVDYIEAHGTGTKVGDPEEMRAVTKVFCEGRKGPLLVGSVKSNMGHPETVAGLCALAKVLLSHAAGILPANLHYKTPNPDIPSILDGRVKVVDKNQPFNGKYVGMNSMGFGGTNVHILLELLPKKEQLTSWNPPTPIVLFCSGRTQEAVEVFLEKALIHRHDQQFVRLTQELVKHDTPKHNYRGYVIVDEEKIEFQVDKRDSGRSMWYILTGLGSQWAGMSRDLIKYDRFKSSIEKSAKIVLRHDFDMISLLECGDSTKFEDFKNSVVSITTIQIALIDLLESIGITPDGIIGHSTGEVASGYADGCLTQEQAVLTSYARVRAVLESNLQPGVVASVGITWEEAKTKCPPGIYPAIHNGEKNVTIAGSPDDVKNFIKQLESEGTFVKLVRSASFGFHSPLVEASGVLAKILLEEIIPNPKERSKKWLSSSVPEARWDTDLAKYCSADYYVNNGVNPVYFYPTLKYVPENAIVLEIAPHCFMQSILKQSLHKNVVKLGLIHVKSPDNCKYFLDSIGKCFLAGINLDMAALYEPVSFPVTADTPNISSMIRWDHAEVFNVPHHKNENNQQKGFKYNISITSENEVFLEGHSIDGKILYPATGYLYIVWRSFAKLQESNSEQLPVVFENVRFDRVTLLSNRSDTEFLVNIFPGNGQFEISQNDMTVCSGIIRNVEESLSKEMLSYKYCDEIDRSGLSMNKEDFYKEMHLRGYGHSGIFQGIETADMNGKWATVKWQGEWISFLDAVIQSFLLRNENRDLYVPIRLQKVTIDPMEVKKALAENDNILNVSCYETFQSGTCPGMEIRGLNFAKFNQRARKPQPSTVEQIFLPYLEQPTNFLSENGAIEASLEIAIENSCGSKFTVLEILKNPVNMISPLIVNQCIVKFPSFESRCVNESSEPIDDETLTAGLSAIVTLKDAQAREKNHVVFVDDETRVADAADVTLVDGFILFKGQSKNNITLPEILLVSEKCFTNEENSKLSYCLFRKISALPKKIKVINMGNVGFNWIDTAKQSVKTLSEFDRIYFVSASPISGIVGFVKCLVREVTSEKIRCFHAMDKLEMNLEEPSEILRLQLQKDLLFNVYKGKVWGTLSNISIPKELFRKQIPKSKVYANALTLGELSSLSWIESPLNLFKGELVQVHYSALNFRDIMLASGKLAQDAITQYQHNERNDCILGYEFSGIYQGRRVLGLGLSECLASQIDASKPMLMDVPNEWTLAEAATVPCVYATVFLALIHRGKMQPGESILIHAGSGGVGQAAIQVALSTNCRVFTTVSTQEKRDFLKSRFPSLTDECFANSRDASDFESHIKCCTNGQGVDLVLNCLAQDKLHASIRCLAFNGRFLEIGKFDIFNDTKLGMSILSKGISVYGIIADNTFNRGSSYEADLLKEFLKEGMASGKIIPLTYHVFQHDQLEESFRFMAQGKHIGKVLIQVRDESTVEALIPSIPRTYFPPDKSYVIIGGLGGMGFELANWMINRGAKKLILTSRSGVQSTYHKYHLDIWNRQGVEVLIDQSDASKFEGAESVLRNAGKLGPIGGIFHVAVVLKDALFDNQSESDFEEVIKCKADAAIHLDTLSKELAPELDYFVVFSSIVSARGNPGQTNYGYANSVMERICEQRKAEGLPALAIQWGAVGDVGVFHRTMKDKKVFGLAPQSLNSCLETLDLCLQQDRTVISSYVPYTRTDMGKIDPNDSLVNIAANILGIKDITKVNPKTPLVDLGMDSLMAAELSQALQSRTNVQLSQKEYTQLTFERLAELDAQAASSGASTSIQQTLIVEKQLNLQSISTKAVSKMKSLSTSNKTVFIIHPMDGTLVMLEELVSQLEADVYGVESVKEAPLDSIENLATFYVQQIKEVQPRGPYKIAGYSFGGTVAFEMALQLERQFETVEVLLLLDSSPRVKYYLEKIDDAELRRQELENQVVFACLSLYKTNMSLKEFKDITELNTWEEKLNYAAKLLHGAYPDHGFEEVRELVGYFVARASCFHQYDTREKVKARTVLVKALGSDLGQDVAYDYGLAEICENPVDVIGVEGNHYCFYEKPLELGIPSIVNKIIS